MVDKEAVRRTEPTLAVVRRPVGDLVDGRSHEFEREELAQRFLGIRRRLVLRDVDVCPPRFPRPRGKVEVAHLLHVRQIGDVEDGEPDLLCPLLVLADQLVVWLLSFASPSWSKKLSHIEHNRRILWTG